ncbi:hypothetical protein [Novosphingobium sp. RL4]|uniref:hypothetical protein n=1 Tax=Novosphingobium sp. RL4 TaxID=3109595 RepID=UPI002D794FFD|nr:hypothetical protein [Novosphingobium sp. RL4]WRT95220.1 hypothetical protein U9J33_23880 [Novosphingobium sp. RL4]
MLGPLLPKLKREAPGVGFNIQLPTREISAVLEDGKLDFQITPEQFLSPEHPSELLFEERHVVVGWRENRVFAGEMTREAFHSCGHVAVRITGVATFADKHFMTVDDQRRIEVTAPSISIVP